MGVASRVKIGVTKWLRRVKQPSVLHLGVSFLPEMEVGSHDFFTTSRHEGPTFGGDVFPTTDPAVCWNDLQVFLWSSSQDHLHHGHECLHSYDFVLCPNAWDFSVPLEIWQ